MKTPITVKKSGMSWNTKYPNIAADTISKYRMGAIVEAGLYLRPYTTNKWEIVAATRTAKGNVKKYIVGQNKEREVREEQTNIKRERTNLLVPFNPFTWEISKAKK